MTRPIRLGDRLEHLLQRQGASLDQVLAAGRTVEFTYGSNTHQGGEPAQVLSQIHPSILQVCEQAVAAVPGLDFAGVDVILPDIAQPVDAQRAGICEINSVPAADSHEFPLYGDPFSVSAEIVRRSAQRCHLQLRARQERVSLTVGIDGKIDSREYFELLAARAKQLGLEGQLEHPSPRHAEGTVTGTVDHVAVWLALIYRSFRGTSVRSVEAQHA